MSQNSQNKTNFWTQKHQELCLKYKIKAAYQQFYYWLVNYSTPGRAIETTLHEFNAWFEKQTGQPLSDRHLKNLINRLLDSGLVKLLKKYRWYEFKLIIKPLEWLEPPRRRVEKKSEIRIDSSKTAPPNDEKTSNFPKEVSQQQLLNIKAKEEVSEETKEEIKKLAKSINMHLPDKCEVYDYPIDKIFLSLNVVWLRNKRKTIWNPIGLLVDCLRLEYYEEPDNKAMLQNAGIITATSEYYDHYV